MTPEQLTQLSEAIKATQTGGLQAWIMLAIVILSVAAPIIAKVLPYFRDGVVLRPESCEAIGKATARELFALQSQPPDNTNTAPPSSGAKEKADENSKMDVPVSPGGTLVDFGLYRRGPELRS